MTLITNGTGLDLVERDGLLEYNKILFKFLLKMMVIFNIQSYFNLILSKLVMYEKNFIVIQS